MDSPLARVIALYLPHYYPTPENDEWRGRGFTDWTNMAGAKPLFPGHYQPHVPADLGFYDLRLPESRAAQAQLAREHGIEAFCYHHYWFGGRRILHRPFDEVLASGQPDFSFCLNWANKTWVGMQNGGQSRVLIEQTYPGVEDHRRHFDALLPAFADQRCVKVGGRPLFVIEQPQGIPDSKRVLDLWRELAVKAGLPGLFIAGQQAEAHSDLTALGYDAAVNVRLPARQRSTQVPWTSPVEKLKFKYVEWRQKPIVRPYEECIELMVADRAPELESFPCVIPNWDNSPRGGGDGLVLHGSTPELFRRHLRCALDSIADVPHDRRIVFVKSWNQWSEGNHLEPDRKFGRGYLQVLRDEITRQESGNVVSNPTVHDVPDRRRSGPRVSSATPTGSIAGFAPRESGYVSRAP